VPEDVERLGQNSASTIAPGKDPAGVNAETPGALRAPPAERRCTAVSGRTGNRCRRWSRPGSNRCAKHASTDRQSIEADEVEAESGLAIGLEPSDVEPDLSGLAIERLRLLMDDSQVPAQTRAYAAKALLDRVADEVPPRPRTVRELEAMPDAELDRLLQHLEEIQGGRSLIPESFTG
jgi:hypothetical protein